MIIVKDTQKQSHVLTESASVSEYDTVDKDLGGAVATIKGRYPEKGFVVNLKVKQLAYVISGAGEVLTPEEKRPLAEGDMIFIAQDEKYAWQGDMILFIANAPRFDSLQYRNVD